MAGSVRHTRMTRELVQLERDPPPGVCCWPTSEASMFELSAQVVGPVGSPYEGGVFRLSVTVPERFPFEPPRVSFLTPVYHPNIDAGGRICLDTLTMPPKGAWRPSLNIATVLTSITLLLAEPNPEDGLMKDITEEFIKRNDEFLAKAREWTRRHAKEGGCSEAKGAPQEEAKDTTLGDVSNVCVAGDERGEQHGGEKRGGVTESENATTPSAPSRLQKRRKKEVV